MPSAPPRACATCGRTHPTRGGGCAGPNSRSWNPDQHRLRGERLQRLRAALFRQAPFCQLCGAVATIRDHRVPLAEGGRDIASNTQALCTACHDAKTIDERRRGIHRSRGG